MYIPAIRSNFGMNFAAKTPSSLVEKGINMNRFRADASEMLLDLGRTVERSRRHGNVAIVVRGNVPNLKDLFRLAQGFATAPDLLKFRAIAEDWSLEELKEALAEAASESSEN